MGVFLKGKNWWIDYYANHRRKREKIGPSRELAQKVLMKRRVEIAEGRFLDIKRNQRVKFDDIAEAYLEKHLKLNCSKGWVYNEGANIRALKRYIGNKCLHEITPLAIEEIKERRHKEGVSPLTVNKTLACLKTIFNKAIDWGKFDGQNPMRKIKKLKVDNKRLRYLEKEEIPRLIDCCPAHLKPIVIVALNTGMRKSEILNLKWHDIDFKRGVISLLKTKNNKPRYIPINKTVENTLIATKKHPESAYVFPGKTGKPYDNFKRSFKTAREKANIENFRFHDLRHTFASQLVMNGVDLNTVRELLGHSTIDMTLRYAHLSPNHTKRAVDLLAQNVPSGSVLRQKEGDLVYDLDTKQLSNVVSINETISSTNKGCAS